MTSIFLPHTLSLSAFSHFLTLMKQAVILQPAQQRGPRRRELREATSQQPAEELRPSI